MAARQTNAVSYCLVQKVCSRIFVYTYSQHTRSETNNIVNRKDGGYEHVYEFVHIGTPSAATIAKINSICPAEEVGDRAFKACSFYDVSRNIPYSCGCINCGYRDPGPLSWKQKDLDTQDGAPHGWRKPDRGRRLGGNGRQDEQSQN